MYRYIGTVLWVPLGILRLNCVLWWGKFGVELGCVIVWLFFLLVSFGFKGL